MRTPLFLTFLLGCGSPIVDVDDPGVGIGSGPPSEVATLSGEITWEIEFDAASGLQDCVYMRRYEGVEDISAPWLCLDCDNVFQVDMQMSDMDRDCYGLISGAPETTEWLGFSDSTFFRGGAPHYQLSNQGDAVHNGSEVTTSSVTDWYDLEDGSGQFQLTVTGALSHGVDSSGGIDPWWGFQTPDVYACGWPKSGLPEYTGDWKIRTGSAVPDGWFKDACGESVRLHDVVAGRYTLVDISAVDCPPCQDMASGERAWIQEMRGAGIDVEVVTLLAPSLSAPLDRTPKPQLNEWVDAFGLESPVLGDRGWGYWVVSEAEPDFAYPSVVLVDPDLNVMQIDVGWGGWGLYTTVITDDAGRR